MVVVDELDRCEALRIQHRGEPLHLGRLGMSAVGFGIPKHEDVNEASRISLLLPHLVSQRTRLALLACPGSVGYGRLRDRQRGGEPVGIPDVEHHAL